MRRLILLICATTTLMSAYANAQTVTDQSDKALDPSMVKDVIAAFTFAVPDPLSAQIIKLRPMKAGSPDICGYINTKNQYGAYTGFKPFRYFGSIKQVNLNDANCD